MDIQVQQTTDAMRMYATSDINSLFCDIYYSTKLVNMKYGYMLLSKVQSNDLWELFIFQIQGTVNIYYFRKVQSNRLELIFIIEVQNEES